MKVNTLARCGDSRNKKSHFTSLRLKFYIALSNFNLVRLVSLLVKERLDLIKPRDGFKERMTEFFHQGSVPTHSTAPLNGKLRKMNYMP